MNSRSLKITISNPCSQLWNEMKVSETGRFCDSCSKNVIDFSGQSDDQIKDFVRKHASEEICGRFYKHQVDRIRIEFDENILNSDIKFWQKFLVILLVCFGSEVMGIDFCLAQTEVQDTTVVAVDTNLIVPQTDTATELITCDTSIIDFEWNPVNGVYLSEEQMISWENMMSGFMTIETIPDEDPIFEPESIIEAFEKQNIVDTHAVKSPGINLNTQLPKPKKQEEEKNQDLRKLMVLTPFLKRRKRRKTPEK